MKLSELKELADKATPGPWVRNGVTLDKSEIVAYAVEAGQRHIASMQTYRRDWANDADLSCAARNHILEVVERVELLSIALESYVVGDHNGVLDDGGQLGIEVLGKVGPDVPLGVRNETKFSVAVTVGEIKRGKPLPSDPDDDTEDLLAEVSRLRAEERKDQDRINLLRSERDMYQCMHINVMNQRTEYAKEVDELRRRIATLFDAIKHGDDKHKGWLQEAIRAHFDLENRPTPPEDSL
jgi:hypothetical protein